MNKNKVPLWAPVLVMVAAVLLLTVSTGGTDAAKSGNGGAGVVLTGQYLDADVVVNIGYDRADWHFDGQWAGRDLAIQQDCDDGFHRVWRFLHEDGPRGKDGRASLPFPEAATSCEGVVVDLDSADLAEASSLTGGSSFTEVSNHVVLVK